jgi:hypothetical protein
MADSCGLTIQNPNVPCEQLDGQLLKWFLITDGTTIADQDTAKLKATMDALIQSGAVVPLPKAHTFEDQSAGATYDDSTTSRITVTNGMITYMLSIKANNEMYKRLASFAGSTNYGIFAASESGKYKMKLNSDGTLGGFALQNINIENQTPNDGSVAEKAPFNFTFADAEEWRKEGVVFKPSYNPNILKALSNVKLTLVGTPNATTIQFKVNKSSDNTDVQAANPVYGLVQADIELLTAAGAAQTIGGLSGGDVAAAGVYTLTGTAFVTGTMTLKAPSLMTTSGYFAENTLTITIA